MSSSPIPSAAAAPVTPTVTTSLKVMTVNTHKGFTALNRKFILPELRDAVRTVGADVVFLQEVLGTHSRHERKVSNWPEAPHYEFLADTMWPQFAYGRNAVYPKGHHGNAVLSKFPIVHFRNHDVSVSGPEKRGLLHCVLRLPGRPVDVHAICAHLGLAEAHRQQQLELLCHIVRDEVPPDAPLIVAGDFNDWRGRAHEVLEKGAALREVFVQANGRAAKTFPARFPVLQLDRIYVRNAGVHAPVVLPRRPWSHLSDHAPLVANIDL
ncbi:MULTISPECIES: endonuclease/exonuclease/phosphatase family protein [unclassified Variovorax]|uniref:endonuclease/exonuclease/phosphatase family protein n=1 Tax=unclassified Variovorax TaxID=663243 RepID=UPI003F45D060